MVEVPREAEHELVGRNAEIEERGDAELVGFLGGARRAGKKLQTGFVY